MSVRNPRRATKAAINRIENKSLMFLLMLTASGGNPRIVDKINREYETQERLQARLERERKPFIVRFRIHWWNVIAVLGASALFVWLIVYVFMEASS